MNETHVTNNFEIIINNFKVFQHDRGVNRSRRGSGGIAIALHNSFLMTHSIVCGVKCADGLMGIKLKNNLNDMLLGIVGCYLSPDNYLYGQDPESYFNEVAGLWADFSDCDLLIGAGDLNSRIRDDTDFLPDIDGNLPNRTNPDRTKNSHGG